MKQLINPRNKLRLLTLPEQHQDLRSLAIFRILLGIYILYDIFSRLKHGRLSLLWYTSSSSSLSFLHPDDTPHKNPIHKLWFYRGSEVVQICLFIITALLATLYSLGYHYNKRVLRVVVPVVPIGLWLNVVAMQCKNMHVHDGSDTFTRHLLLWSCFLPINQVFSLDSLLFQQKQITQKSMENKNKTHFKNPSLSSSLSSYQVQNNNIGVWGIRLQIIFMYLGTILARTYDIYGLSIHNLFSNCEWLPPSLTAVYYSLNASFASRDCWLGNFIRNNLLLTRVMTLSAMIIEGIVPIACLFIGMMMNKKRKIKKEEEKKRKNGQWFWYEKCSYILPLLMFKLHFGLLLLMNLPNWQFIGMAATTIWIPSFVWEYWQRKLSLWFPRRFSPPSIPQSIETRHKKDISEDDNHSIDGYNVDVDSNDTNEDVQRLVENNNTLMKKHSANNVRYISSSITIHNIFKYFFFLYMIYNFAGEHKLISKHDGGDIGEFFRFSQYWVMFATPPKSSVHDIFMGKIRRSNVDSVTSNGSTGIKNNQTETIDDLLEIDVWQWMKNGKMVPIDLEKRRNEIWSNMTHIYPSPRLERLFSQWSGRKNTRALNYFLNKMCEVGSFESLTFIWQHLRVRNPSDLLTKGPRFTKYREDSVFSVRCFKEEDR